MLDSHPLMAAEGWKGQTVRLLNWDLIWVQIGESQIGFSLRLKAPLDSTKGPLGF